jgi:hypothetical protein
MTEYFSLVSGPLSPVCFEEKSTMTFDIRQLDKLDPDEEETEEALGEYEDELIELFLNSPEGQEWLKVDPEPGFWIHCLIDYGYHYLGATLPKMTQHQAEEVVTELFPRKVSTFSPDDADQAIPELIAFWEYLKREYNLRNADPILKFLRQVQPKFKAMMNNPANFGMAKSFFMQGQAAGFDMTTNEGNQAFMTAYNAALLSGKAEPLPPSLPFGYSPGGGFDSPFGRPATSSDKKAKAKKKAQRKMAQASRKKNKKRK